MQADQPAIDYEATVIPTYPYRSETQQPPMKAFPDSLSQPVLVWQMILFVTAIWLVTRLIDRLKRSQANQLVLLACVLGMSGSIGCTESSRWREILRSQPEEPAANLPQSLRQTNWEDAYKSGSCAVASSCSALQWVKQPQKAALFRQYYAGGQTAKSIKDIWRENREPFVATETREDLGNPEFLEWASKTRRMAIIWYFPSHCVSFCGFGKQNGRDVAWLLDNNRTKKFIPIEKNQFIAEWRGYGGFALIPTRTPAPSMAFQGYEVR